MLLRSGRKESWCLPLCAAGGCCLPKHASLPLAVPNLHPVLHCWVCRRAGLPQQAQAGLWAAADLLLLLSFCCCGSPFLRRSGFPFFTVAMTMSPGPPAGRRFSLLPQPHTLIMYRFLAPVLSAQFITAATGRPSDMENLLPEVPPLPRFDILATCEGTRAAGEWDAISARWRWLRLALPWQPDAPLCSTPQRSEKGPAEEARSAKCKELLEPRAHKDLRALERLRTSKTGFPGPTSGIRDCTGHCSLEASAFSNH